MLVRECLKSAPVTIPPTCTIEESAQLMSQHGMGALLVVSDGELLGIVTDRDIVIRAVAKGLPLQQPVRTVMAEHPVTLQGSADIIEALDVLKRANVRRFPVLEDGEVAGILTVDDVLVALVVELHAAVAPIAHEMTAPEIPA